MSAVSIWKSLAAGLTGLALAGASQPLSALAQSRGLESGGPNCGVAQTAADWPSVWLGHFAGGRIAPAYSGERVLDWQDRYFCFPSRAACAAWQKSMAAAYRGLEGYRTCLVIHDGPIAAPPPPQNNERERTGD